jgi:hypothetical protein
VVVYFTGGPPRQAVAQGSSNPQGPQPDSVSPKAVRITNATTRAIRTPSTGNVYTEPAPELRGGAIPKMHVRSAVRNAQSMIPKNGRRFSEKLMLHR